MSGDGAAFEFSPDVVTEQVVLAAALVDRDARKRLLKYPPETFLAPEHRLIWQGLHDLARRGLAYDPATLSRMTGGAVDPAYLAKLTVARPDVPANLDFHVDALLWDRAKATALEGPLAALLEALRDPNEPPDHVQALAAHVSAALNGYQERVHLHDTNELVRAQMAEIRARVQGHAIYPYGIAGLDYADEERKVRRMVPGAAPGQITVITATPGSGKSTFTAHIILGLARMRRRVLVGAWEMTGGMSLELLAVISLGWSRTELLTPKTALGPTGIREGVFLTEERLVELEARMRSIAKFVRFMKLPRVRGKKQRNDDVLDVVEGYIADTAPDVCVFDLWKRCLPETKPEQEEDALDRQQEMVKAHRVHAILVQQQRLKDVEARPDKRPTREGIKGSGAWVEVGDTILGLHRPALWSGIPDNVIEADVLKQRYAKWPQRIEFDWDPDAGGVSGGRTVNYDAPSSASGRGRTLDDVTSAKVPKKSAGRGRPRAQSIGDE